MRAHLFFSTRYRYWTGPGISRDLGVFRNCTKLTFSDPRTNRGLDKPTSIEERPQGPPGGPRGPPGGAQGAPGPPWNLGESGLDPIWANPDPIQFRTNASAGIRRKSAGLR